MPAAESLTVRFEGCEAGWIDLRLTAGQQTLNLRASHLLDPLPDLLAWLEAASLGLPRCGWTLDEEFQRVNFDIRDADLKSIFGRRPDPVVLTVAPDYDVAPLICTLTRRDLVRVFYGALRDFVTSDRYRPAEWELLSLGDRVREKTGQDPTIWAEALLANPLSRRELQKRFWQIHGGTVTGGWHDPEFMGTAREYAEMSGSAEPLRAGTSPLYWMLSDWEALPDINARRAYLAECLADTADSAWRGLPWRRLRSAWLEAWLDREESLSASVWSRWQVDDEAGLGPGGTSAP